MTLEDTTKFKEAKGAELVNDHKQLSRTRMLRQYPRLNRRTKTNTKSNAEIVEKQAMVMAVIHRIGRRSASPGIKFVQSVTKRFTSPTSVGLNTKRIGGNTKKDVYESNTVFHKMCNSSVTSHKIGQRAVAFDHIFDDRNGWITRRSPPQTTVFLTARAHTKDYEELGYRLHTRTYQITIAMMADTGCQSVLVGIKIIHRLGFKKSDLIPLKTKISGEIVTSSQF